jgi:hypothetical protein
VAIESDGAACPGFSAMRGRTVTPPARGADARSANLHVTIYYPDLEIAISIGAHHVSPAAAPPLLGRPSQASQQRGQALSRLQILEVGQPGAVVEEELPQPGWAAGRSPPAARKLRSP